MTDPKERVVFGHIVAGSTSSGFAYMIPLRQVIGDLNRRLPGGWFVSHHNALDGTQIDGGKIDGQMFVEAGRIRSRMSTKSLNSNEDIQNPESHPVVQEFLSTLSKPEFRCLGIRADTMEATHGYISLAAIQEAVRKPGMLESLVESVIPRGLAQDDITAIRSQYLRVFCILLRCRCGSEIQAFIHNINLCDGALPFEMESDFASLSEQLQVASSALFRIFYHQRWEFCPEVLRYGMDVGLDKNVIIPVSKINKISNTGTAEIYKIVIDEEYNELRGRTVGEQSVSKRSQTGMVIADV